MRQELESLIIGDAQLMVSEVAFGCARLVSSEDAKNSEKMLEACIRGGINFFDTAPMYGSEDILGDFFAGDKSVIISTKVGIEPSLDNSGKIKNSYRRLVKPLLTRVPVLKHFMIKALRKQRNFIAPIRRKLEAQEIMMSVERSLLSLKRDKLDILLLHEPDQFFIDEELVAVFESIRAQGLISSYGLGYGRSMNSGEAPFGSILQGRFLLEAPIVERVDMSVIYHGVVREALDGVNYFKGKTFQSNLINSLGRLHGVTKIMSASSPSQLDYLLNCCAMS